MWAAKTGTPVAYDSAGASGNKALGNDTTLDASASPYNLGNANGYVTFLVAAGIVLAVTVVLVADLTPTARAAV
jgi:hypothetical protein